MSTVVTLITALVAMGRRDIPSRCAPMRVSAVGGTVEGSYRPAGLAD